MNLSVIALDYDGTIASHGVLDPSVLEAIGVVRRSGITVLLVTGRILDELRRVAGELHFVDAVVAENGAVLHFPAIGHTKALAPPVPTPFIDELRRRGIPFQAGQCLVDTEAAKGTQILEVVRSLELPLVLVFNASRLMVLGQGVSKATGLQGALQMLRLSARNTLAIGDAENDHELLRLAEVGVAVGWGSAALRAAADITLEGSGPADVAGYLRSLVASKTLPVPPRARRTLLLGHSEDGCPFSLAVRGRNVLVTGDTGSGKSWIAGLLCEQLILYGYSVCVIDPEGDYRSLELLPGVTVLGGEDPPPTPRELLRALRYPDQSVVIDLSHQPQDEKLRHIRSLLPALNVLRARTGLPHRIVVDEAHYFLHGPDALQLLDLERNGYTVVTYRASRLPPELLSATEVMIVTCESNPAELQGLRARCAGCGGVDPERWAMVRQLRTGQAVALPVTEEAGGDLRLFTVGPRLTPHVRHRHKYADLPVADHHAFVFTGQGRTQRVRTLRDLVAVIESEAPEDVEPYLRRHDFSRWIGDIFGDHALSASIEKLERAARSGRVSDEIVAEIGEAIRARYDLLDD